MNVRSILATALLGVATVTSLSLAQDAGGNNNPGGNNPGGGGNNAGGGNRGGGDRQRGEGGGQRGNFDPAQFRQQMMQRFKEQLKVPDDEWKVIEPKLTKVLDAQRDVPRGGWGGGGGRGRGGPGGGGGDQQPTTEAGIAQRDLRTAIENEGASPEELEKKLTAYRAAREKAEAKLDEARKELKEVLSPRQEAALVLSGQLE